MKKVSSSSSISKNLIRQKELVSSFVHNYDLSISRDNERFKELKEAAIFLTLYSHEWQITLDREKPDFIISNGFANIGLEHTRIFDERIKSNVGSIEDLFLKSKNLLIKEDFDSNYLLNIYIKDSFIPHKKDSSVNIKEICKTIKLKD